MGIDHRRDLEIIQSVLISLHNVVEGMLESLNEQVSSIDDTIGCTHEDAEDASAFGNQRLLCKKCMNFIEADGKLVPVKND